MIWYLGKRLLWLIPVVIAVSFIVYSLFELAPGSIIDTMVSESMTDEDIAELRARYDLDRTMFYRYAKYMLNLVQGDMGESYVSGMSVLHLYLSRLPNTLLLSFSALIIASAIAIPMGIRAAMSAGTLVDNAMTTFTLIGMSMPGFWVGLLLLIVFSLNLGWFPGGRFEHGIRSLILPAVCSGLVMTATATRQTRSSMLEVLRSDYLRTARAKGVPEIVVIRKHALGNAMIPILTALGGSLSFQLAGSVVVEQVFAWPGVGRLAAEAVLSRDVPTVLGCVILTTLMYVLVHLIVDVLYAFADPRIKAQYVNSAKMKKRTGSVSGKQGAKRQDSSGDTALPEHRHSEPGSAADSAASVSGSAGAELLEAQLDNVPVMQIVDTPNQKATEEAAAGQTASTDGLHSAEAIYKAESKAGGGADDSIKSGRVTVSNSQNEPSKKAGEKPDKTDAAHNISRFKKRSISSDIFKRLLTNKGSMVGLIIIAVLFVAFIASVFLIDYGVISDSNVSVRFSSPSLRYPFGTDNMGRDLFQRVIYGTRYSLAIGFGSAFIAVTVGVTFGSLAGYYGGRTEDIIMRCSDVLASIPGMLLGMVIVTVLGKSLPNLIFAVGVTAIPPFIRITRASVLTVSGNEFVEAARAIGLPNLRVIFTQVLPNGLSPIIVMVTANLGVSLLVAASLSFLGFGLPVGQPEWGALVSAGRSYLRNAPHMTTFPGLFIMITVLAFNLIGDGLRDALDPKMKK